MQNTKQTFKMIAQRYQCQKKVVLLIIVPKFLETVAQFLQTLNTDCFVKTPHIKGLKTTLSLFKLNPPPKIIHTAVLCLCLIEHQRNARVVKTSNRVLMAIYFLNDLL